MLVIATRRQLTAADMASTQVPFAVSDLVTFRGHTCIILEIRREHGFHTYQLRDLDTGVIARAFRYELKPADATPLLVDLSDDVWGLNDVGRGGPGMQGNTAEQGRFATVSTEDLDGLASKRTSQSTKGQTKWAVQIFKGKHVAMFIFTFRWCRHWWVKGRWPGSSTHWTLDTNLTIFIEINAWLYGVHSPLMFWLSKGGHFIIFVLRVDRQIRKLFW